MSAAVCGSKRALYEDVASPPVTKRIRFTSSSSNHPIRSSPAESRLDEMRSLFPHLEIQVLDKKLRECGGDLDAAISSFHETPAAWGKSDSAENLVIGRVEGFDCNEDIVATGENPDAPDNLPASGTEWVELLIREMNSGMKDAKARVHSLLEILEKSINARAGEAAAHLCQKENIKMKQQVEALLKENSILKRGIAIQHERQKDYEDMSQNLQYLKELISQYQERQRNLEITNYALRMHLKQAQQCSSFPGRFNPDVF